MLIYAMVGEACNLITGFTGQTSFGHAAYFGIGAYTSTILLENFHITPWIGMLVGGAIAALLAFVVNFQMFRLKGHYFAIATLCVAEILRVIFSKWEYVGAGDGIALTPINTLVPGSPKSAWGKIAWLSLDVRDRIPFLLTTLAAFVIIFVLCLWLENSKMGFYWKAIRESHEVAESCGDKPEKLQAGGHVHQRVSGGGGRNLFRPVFQIHRFGYRVPLKRLHDLRAGDGAWRNRKRLRAHHRVGHLLLAGASGEASDSAAPGRA